MAAITSHVPVLLLSGFMGTGKTTVGRIVAERAGVPFLDLDEAIEAAAGKPVASIFAEDGEAAFRLVEADALRRALEGGAPRVVSLGGGTLLDPESRRAALARARVVTLTARPETIARRTAGSERPLLAATPDELDRSARIRRLLEVRAAAYAETHARVPTDGRSPGDVAASVLGIWPDRALVVPLGSRSYPVRIAADPARAVADALDALDPTGVFVVTDANVSRLWGGAFHDALAGRGFPSAATVVLAPGEQNKRLAAVEEVLSSILGAGADRRAVVVGVGGGVVTDIAGFAASTLLRGVRWVAVPTTLLAMVDASVGGKTGVDLGAAKNAVGTFHQPSAVVVGPSFLSTEAARGYTSGLAEVVKAACIGDTALFDLLERASDAVLARSPEVVEELLARSIGVKIDVVSRDEREAGDRALLNLGHTLGHALEAQGGFERLAHGEAVSLGMVAMLRAGCELGVTDPAEAARVTSLLARLGLPTDLAREPVEDSLRFLALDKKRLAGSVRAVLLRKVGEPFLQDIGLDALADLLRRAASGPRAPVRGA